MSKEAAVADIKLLVADLWDLEEYMNGSDPSNSTLVVETSVLGGDVPGF